MPLVELLRPVVALRLGHAVLGSVKGLWLLVLLLLVDDARLDLLLLGLLLVELDALLSSRSLRGALEMP